MPISFYSYLLPVVILWATARLYKIFKKFTNSNQAIPQFIFNIANIVSKSFHHFYYETDTYLSSCLVSLKCSMDVQSSDGRSLLLKYLSSYVTKMKDHKRLKGFIHFTRNLHLYERSYIFYLIQQVLREMFIFYIYTVLYIIRVLEILSISINCHHFLGYVDHFPCPLFIFFVVIYFSDIDIHDIAGYTVGTQYLNNLQISSAEMTQYLYNIKMSYTNYIT